MNKKPFKKVKKRTNRVKHSRIEKLDNFRPLIILFSILSLTATGLYFSAKAVNNTSTIVTSMPDTYTITGSSIDLDLSSVIELPSSGWSDTTDRISIEVSITNGSADDAIVDRSTDGCSVDISSSSTSSTFGSTQGNGSVDFDGDATNNVFIFNDRTAQVTLLGIASEVKEAIGRVRASCSSQSVFAGKYIRVGAVPTIGYSGGGGSGTTDCGDANTDCENLYYLFSTQHYYRVARMTSGVSSGTQGILDVWNKAKSITVGVDGTRKSGATIRGFVATLHTRDELLLTDAIRGTGNSSLSMIGTTDLTQSFTYDTNWGGTGSACSAEEGTFYWLGPDRWCRLIPTWNANFPTKSIEYSPSAQTSASSPNHEESRYWSRDSSGIWSRGTSSSFTIDLGSSTIPTTEDQSGTHNGYNFFHGWHSNTAPDEPNSSGDYIYLGYGGSGGNPGWDDAGPGDSTGRVGQDNSTITGRFIQEFCNPNQTCTPDANAVDSAQFKIAQTITFSGASSAYATETVNLTAASTTSGLTISYATNNSNICTVSSSAVVTLVSRGTCEVTASQSGNDDYLAATSVTQSFTSNFGPVFVGVVTSCTGIGQLENGSFETFNLGSEPNPQTNPPKGKWHGYAGGPEQILFLDTDAGLNQSVSPWDTGATDKIIELQRAVTGFVDTNGTLDFDQRNVSPNDGSFFAELNANEQSYLYQDVSTLPGSVLRWEIFHRGRKYTATSGDGDVMKVQIGTTSATGYGSSSSQNIDQTPESNTDIDGTGTSGSVSGTQIKTERSDGWQRVRGVYRVPTGQTTTRFAFSAVSALHSIGVGNLLDNISFTPNVACPFTKSIITGRTATINVFDDAALTDAEESIAGADSTIANTISVTSGSGSVIRANSNRSMQFTAPNSTGTSVVRFRVSNSFGDTADADATFNIVSDLSHVAPTVIPVDPRATQVDLPQVDVVGSTVSKAMVCYVQSDSSGNSLGTPNLNSQIRTPGSNTVSTTSATSAELSINGAIADVESSSSSVRITSTTLNGRVLDTNTSKYIRIRTSGDDDVSTESCGNGTGASRQTVLELRPVQLETTRNLNVEIN